MLIVNAVEVNSKLHLMAELPEKRREEVLAALEQYDKSFQGMEVMKQSQLDEVRIQLTNQSAKAVGYKKVVA
ncbi:MAG: hypothetical protein R3Y67_04385 [Eubacteriales bacterium]